MAILLAVKTDAFPALALFLIFLVVLLIVVIRYILHHVAAITFTKDKIRLKFLMKEVELEWDDILEIQLTGTHQMNMFLNIAYDAAKIITQNHRSYFLSYQHYSNHITLLKMLEQVSILKKNTQAEQTIQLGHYQGKRRVTKPFKLVKGKKYSGTVFRSLSFYQNFIFFLLGLWILSFMNSFALLLGLGVILFCYLNSGKKFNHFIISDTHLIIKNYFLFLRKSAYELNEIREVVIEEPRKSPIQLKVITDDFEYTAYIGAGLNNQKWKALIAELSEKQVKVRTEIQLY